MEADDLVKEIWCFLTGKLSSFKVKEYNFLLSPLFLLFEIGNFSRIKLLLIVCILYF